MTKALVDARLVPADARLLFNIIVATADAVSIEVRSAKQGWYHVKASRGEDLALEFTRQRIAHARFGSRSVEPVACIRVAEWSLLVARTVEHKPVRASDLARDPRSSGLGRDLIDFFGTARKAQPALDESPVKHAEFFGQVRQYLDSLPTGDDRVRRQLAVLAPELWRQIPLVPQHGDFVLNNLGVANGRLIVFDWEDYGRSALAGFDIFMISLSIMGLHADAVQQIQQTSNPSGHPWALAEAACSVSDLPYATFREAIPLYLLAFRYLKRNYSERIRERIDEILARTLPA